MKVSKILKKLFHRHVYHPVLRIPTYTEWCNGVKFKSAHEYLTAPWKCDCGKTRKVVF